MTIQELYLALQRYNMAQRNHHGEPPIVVIRTGTDGEGHFETMPLQSIQLNIDANGMVYLVLIPGE